MVATASRFSPYGDATMWADKEKESVKPDRSDWRDPRFAIGTSRAAPMRGVELSLSVAQAPFARLAIMSRGCGMLLFIQPVLNSLRGHLFLAQIGFARADAALASEPSPFSKAHYCVVIRARFFAQRIGPLAAQLVSYRGANRLQAPIGASPVFEFFRRRSRRYAGAGS
ncbi:hypothetical protein ON010_g8471 [Phytophthora cinnamomi]|nr:hypothetical protein ON010_g8471 [Phytophthora cinnamomi]